MQISALSDLPDLTLASMDQRPHLICLDAVGTLFGVKASVGSQYQIVAKAFGVDCDAKRLDAAFYPAFQAAPKAAFPNLDAQARRHQELEWWQAIAETTFTAAGYRQQFADFDAFFASLFEYFATAAPWEIYPDVVPVLRRWQELGIALAVVSNFDSRLHQVLPALGLDQFFTSVTLSTEAGWAKPDGEIFAVALAKVQAQVQPHQVWHVGDSRREDYEAALACGLEGFWLKRD
jgi:putative hydrolase of the HAD superfamily